ncbi:MAG: prepilin-type N-terminal cleavage/methylation domain-containing protein [Planctomycetota bacterium]
MDPESHRLPARTSGMSLIELSVSLTVLSVVVVSTGMTLTSGIRERQESLDDLRALSAVRTLIAEIQEVTNGVPDPTQNTGPGAIFGLYDGQSLTIDGLDGATIDVSCFADETAVPAELGGPQDLNFDGDAQDQLDNQSNGTDLKAVPTVMTVSFGDAGEHAHTIYRTFTRTTN